MEEKMGGKSLLVLVVDDEPAIRLVVESNLKAEGYTVETAKNGTEALARLEKGDVDIAVCDIKMPGMDGIEVVRTAKGLGVETLFLIMTAYASVDTAIQAMKAGAYDYLIKPFRREDILLRVAQASNMIGLTAQNQVLRQLVKSEEQGKCFMPSSGMQQIERLVRKVAPTDYTALIMGESGTGKGVVARRIHQLSKRSEAIFMPVNCGSIPENLMESEFFGHTKGAFTGADKAKKGLFVEADKGTLFLDEIGELPLALQVKLLHVLEEKQIRPVGSERFRGVDVRIIAATNRDLRQMVADGSFREDLFFRLNVFNIQIPSLRERKEDVLPLLRYFLEQKRDRSQTRSVVLDPDAENALLQHDWPGNVREMEHVVERAIILAEDGVISLADLPSNIAVLTPISSGQEDDFSALSGTLREQLRLYEIRVIQKAIEEAAGDRKLASRRLGIGLSSLYRKLEQVGL